MTKQHSNRDKHNSWLEVKSLQFEIVLAYCTKVWEMFSSVNSNHLLHLTKHTWQELIRMESVSELKIFPTVLDCSVSMCISEDRLLNLKMTKIVSE